MTSAGATSSASPPSAKESGEKSLIQFLNSQILELRAQRAGLMAELDKRNEATRVWIQAETQARAYANQLEKELRELTEKSSDVQEPSK